MKLESKYLPITGWNLFNHD